MLCIQIFIRNFFISPQGRKTSDEVIKAVSHQRRRGWDFPKPISYCSGGDVSKTKIACALTKGDVSATAQNMKRWKDHAPDLHLTEGCQHVISHGVSKVGHRTSNRVVETSPQRLVRLSIRFQWCLWDVAETYWKYRGDIAETSQQSGI